ncbi:unnamed protein product [Bursaphelenchus okinawaensis]|uniref:SHSP domain-containing protein n=1 Tax=Bursaphelenchus okinawaensis TaxID=465554 RepID=A0A811KCW3_9BILA|nr:unnamed protein product [Bursaphelenchus okinawaensis]CAG9101893.1 unnamed protein product [Bursaphelenchus okinawaensis]
MFPVVYESFGFPRRHHGCPSLYRPQRDLEGLVDALNTVSTIQNVMNAVEKEHNGYYVNNVEFNNDGDMTVHCETEGFKPEELTVDLDGDVLKVSGLHKEEKENELIERTFSRQIRIPKNMDLQKIACHMEENGKMTVTVPVVQAVEPKKQNIPIQMKKAEEKEASNI